MKGAIYFSSKYGNTKQYAEWISEVTALSVFDMKNKDADPSKYDFLFLGLLSSITSFTFLNIG